MSRVATAGGEKKRAGPRTEGWGALLSLVSRAAGSGSRNGVFEMGTALDIKVKRANKVYHAGVGELL